MLNGGLVNRSGLSILHGILDRSGLTNSLVLFGFDFIILRGHKTKSP